MPAGRNSKQNADHEPHRKRLPNKERTAVPGLPDLTNLKRVAMRVESTGRVKDLKGFLKGYSTPESNSSLARNFLARIAADDIKADIDETYQTIRDNFGFKRRQIESSSDGCSGVIRTPNFEYSVKLALDPSDTSRIVWRREVGSFRDPLTVRSPEFVAAFGSVFNILYFEFAAPIRVDQFVDRIEEDDRPGVKVKCARDSTSCEITLIGFHGVIRVDRSSLTIEGTSSPSAASLLDQFIEFMQRYPQTPGLS